MTGGSGVLRDVGVLGVVSIGIFFGPVNLGHLGVTSCDQEGQTGKAVKIQ